MTDANERICTECGEPRGAGGARGMCQRCYKRWKKTFYDQGLPLPPVQSAPVRKRAAPAVGADRQCWEPGCTSPVGEDGTRGRCAPCYEAARGAGTCINDWCTNPVGKAGARGMCSRCYQRWRNDLKARNLPLPPIERGQQITADGTKACTKCGKHKSVHDFTWDGKRGRPFSQCRACRRESDKKVNQRLNDGVDRRKPGKQAAPEGSTSFSYGYVLEKRIGHHRASKNGWVRQHILVAEEKYGIKITSDFTVHHKNGDTKDNRPSNLELRVGKHGKHANAVEGLLVSDVLREHAVRVLREYYGYTVLTPSTSTSVRRLSVVEVEQMSLALPDPTALRPRILS